MSYNITTTSIWTAIYAQIELINKLNSVDEFYGVITPIKGVKEVYDRLTEWRKEAYRDYIMSGDLDAERADGVLIPIFWDDGLYSPNPQVMSACVKENWWGTQREEDISWEKVCNLSFTGVMEIDIPKEVEFINKLNSIDEFHGKVTPFPGKVKEVYDHLRGWRKEAYKNLLMSGSWTLIEFQNQNRAILDWKQEKVAAPVSIVKKYYGDEWDYMYPPEENISLSWNEVCELYSF